MSTKIERRGIQIMQAMGYTPAIDAYRKAIQNALGLPSGMKTCQSYDLIKAPADVDLEDEWSVRKHWNRITLIELKATSQKKTSPSVQFTAQEIALAYMLGKKLKLAILNIDTKEIIWDTVRNAFMSATNVNVSYKFTYKNKKSKKAA